MRDIICKRAHVRDVLPEWTSKTQWDSRLHGNLTSRLLVS
jgi:hypothetical protein